MVLSSAELSGNIGTKEDTSAQDNTGPSHGKVDGCACVISRELGLYSSVIISAHRIFVCLSYIRLFSYRQPDIKLC